MKPKIDICMGSSCFARGNKENLQAVMDFMEKAGLHDGVDLSISGSLCQGRCRKGPNIRVNGELFTVDNAAVAVELVKKSLAL